MGEGLAGVVKGPREAGLPARSLLDRAGGGGRDGEGGPLGEERQGGRRRDGGPR